MDHTNSCQKASLCLLCCVSEEDQFPHLILASKIANAKLLPCSFFGEKNCENFGIAEVKKKKTQN